METYFEMVEDYVLGALSPQNKRAFEDALQKDEALAAYLRQFQEMQQRLEIYRIRSGVHDALKEAPQQQLLTTSRRNHRMAWAAAASIALLLATVWITFKSTSSIDQNRYTLTSPTAPVAPKDQTDRPIDPPSTDVQKNPENTPVTARGNNKSRFIALADTYYTAPSGSGFRDASTDPNPVQKSPVQLAIEAFESKKYGDAAGLLKADSLVSNDELARYVRAHARYKTGQYTSAAHDFETLKDSFQYEYEARWNLLLCWVAMGKGKETEAQKLLAEMLADPDFPYLPKARQLADNLQVI